MLHLMVTNHNNYWLIDYYKLFFRISCRDCTAKTSIPICFTVYDIAWYISGSYWASLRSSKVGYGLRKCYTSPRCVCLLAWHTHTRARARTVALYETSHYTLVKYVGCNLSAQTLVLLSAVRCETCLPTLFPHTETLFICESAGPCGFLWLCLNSTY